MEQSVTTLSDNTSQDLQVSVNKLPIVRKSVLILCGILIAFSITVIAVIKYQSKILDSIYQYKPGSPAQAPSPTTTLLVKNQPESNVGMFKWADPTNSFSVEFPVDWFKVSPSNKAPWDPEYPTRATCDKSSIKECLDDMIVVTKINNPKSLTIFEIAYKDSDILDEIKPEKVGVNSFSDGTPISVISDISAMNLIRHIYYKNDEQTIVRIILKNVGDDDQRQIITTLRRISTPKVYLNNKLGYTIQYPGYFHFFHDYYLSPVINDKTEYMVTPQGFFPEAVVVNNSTGLSLKDLSLQETGFVNPDIELVRDNDSAEILLLIDISPGSGPLRTAYIHDKLSSRFLQLTFQLKDIALIKEIASSFKTNDTGKWTTFTSQFGYSIKYPSGWEVSAPGLIDPKDFYVPVFSSSCNFDAGDICSSIMISSVLYGKKKIESGFYPQINEKDKFSPDFVIVKNDIIVNKVNLELDSQPAVGFEHFRSNYSGSTKWEYVVVSDHSNTRYTITYEESVKNSPHNAPKDWQNKDLFDSILDTFKFAL